jgi:hypothetical protein
MYFVLSALKALRNFMKTIMMRRRRRTMASTGSTTHVLLVR